ncbi:CesT family type III secretion system chaperone [Parashewanella tropica]|uniref:CesT family type III secretion system chaperone n=1 Tax=Parashewanella tropica TaxID=2547970 RepID=UPI001059EC1F|nr:CesT family type III secretion system chaperone [Parashewanella tropica]
MYSNRSAKELVLALINSAGFVDSNQLEENVCLLIYEPDINIVISWSKYTIKLSCAIGKVVNSSKYQELITKVLEDNRQACSKTAYQYSLDSKNQQLILSVILPAELFEPDSFIDYFNNFKQDLEVWMEHLDNEKFYMPNLKQHIWPPVKTGQKLKTRPQNLA